MNKKNETNRRNFIKSGALLGAGVCAIPAMSFASGEYPVSDIANIWDAFDHRRSVRNFKSIPVPKQHIQKIIHAARMAPTSGNQQPWKFIVVDDRSMIDKLKETCISLSLDRINNADMSDEDKEKRRIRAKEYYTNYLSAPVYIIILTDGESKYPTYNHWDGPLAAGYLMLAARALGYGTVFVTDSIPEQVTKEVFDIPDRYTRVCITPIGVPVEWPNMPEKNDLESFIIENKF